MSDFETIDIEIHAKNSSGAQTLSITKQLYDGAEDYFFTIFGDFDGKDIQFDFDSMTEKGIDELILSLQLLKEAKLVAEETRRK